MAEVDDVGGPMTERVANALMAMTRDVDCGDLKLKDHYRMARAAIAAMREPTEPMIQAGILRRSLGPVGTWRTMIDAALAGQSSAS